MPSIRETPFDDFDTAVSAMVAWLAAGLGRAVALNGRATLAVGGGRTPRDVLPLLAAAVSDWSSITVTLTDDRRVPVNDPDSNEGLVQRWLLYRGAGAAQFFPLGDVTVPPPLPDVVYLGFGLDGHVASLFPGGAELAVRRIGLVEVLAPAAPVRRVSMTLPMLLSARSIAILVAGAEKRDIYARAKTEAAAPQLPLAHVLHSADTDIFIARD
jgi:6-phosphogluconolactonase